MFCFQVKKKISLFIDGEVNDVEKNKIIEHLNKCQECNYLYSSLKNTTEKIRNLEKFTVPPYLFSQIESKILNEKIEAPLSALNKIIKFPYLLPSLTTVSIILIIFISSFNFFNKKRTEKEEKIANFVIESFSDYDKFYNAINIDTIYDFILDNDYENDEIYKFLEGKEVII